MADYLPRFKPGQAVTFTATTAITGGRLVEVSGDRSVGTAAADSAKVVGTAGFDAAIGESVTVYDGGVQRLTASGVIAVGARVIAAATGKIATVGAGANPIGIALQAAAADGDVIDVQID